MIAIRLFSSHGFFFWFQGVIMKRAKALVVAEQATPQVIPCEPSYMVCLESSDGHRFLVDRNCAMVSGVMRQAMRNKLSDFDDNNSSHVAANATSTADGTVCPASLSPTTFETATFSSSIASSVCSEDCASTMGNLMSPTQRGEEVCTMTKIGSLEYEVIKLDEIPGDLLDLAVQEMYYKYRYDGEPEKRPQEPTHTVDMRYKLAALSVLLDM
ncbi:hypothetical protein, conserved [Trypanosoma brucei brucei TREU927]|uniref:SKP1 component POZ domain-containing protein n=3 Tax=Trypanozoon TaxID=39700 RepID=Q384S1_TRYB2|nr:hypothetical protein, conserved [Trypanosoma brucei brucei TREU927]EAN79710.1 hypothetical protein, conserved [Trypanosoma brucei brucei TREU927]